MGVNVRLVLPYPPSANRYWRNWRGRIVVSEEAREYKRRIQLNYAACPLMISYASVKVEMLFYRPTKSGDLDNRIKVTLDALKGVAFSDDKQVCHIVAARFEDKRNPRVEVTVEAVDSE